MPTYDIACVMVQILSYVLNASRGEKKDKDTYEVIRIISERV